MEEEPKDRYWDKPGEWKRRRISKKQIERQYNNEMLERAGYKTFRVCVGRVQIEKLLILACNKLRPEDPFKALDVLRNIDHRIFRFGRGSRMLRAPDPTEKEAEIGEG